MVSQIYFFELLFWLTVTAGWQIDRLTSTMSIWTNYILLLLNGLKTLRNRLFAVLAIMLLFSERSASQSGDNVCYIESRRFYWEPLSVSCCSSCCEGKTLRL